MRGTAGRGTTAIAAVTAGIMIAQQVAASAVRDAFFLAHYPPAALSTAVIVSSVLSVAFLPLLARTMARHGPAAVTPLIAGISALLLVVEWASSQRWPQFAAGALFVHTMVFGSVLVSGFWSAFNERFDPHTAKQLMGRVAGGAAFGGIVGGLLVERAGAAGVDVPNLLPILAGVQLAAAFGTRVIGSGPVRRASADAAEPAESLSHLLSSPYLRDIALIVGLTAFVSTLTSFLLKAEAASSYFESAQLLRFFARYYLVLGLIGFLLQINLARPVLSRFGLSLTIGILPAALGTLGLVSLAVPGLWSLALLRGADESISNSLFRSGYELLYTPMAAGTKRRFKAIVDVGFDRLGKSIGSGVVLLVMAMAAASHTRILLVIATVTAFATLLVSVRLSRGYVVSLTRSLKSQAVSFDANVDEPITLRTIAAVGVDRARLLAALSDAAPRAARPSQIDFGGGEGGVWATQSITIGGAESAALKAAGRRAEEPSVDPVVARIVELRASDARRVVAALQAEEPLDRHLVPHVISLLAREDVRHEAEAALRGVVDRSAAQMVDTLLDRTVSPVIRRRLPQVLAASTSRIAVEGLLQALDDPEFDVRFRSAGALVRIREARPDLAIPRDTVFEAAVRELRRARPLLESDGLDRADRKPMMLVFGILSLVLEPEPLRIAHHAFRGDDTHLRGTALEYLETVLPPQVLHELRPLVGTRSPASATRTRREIESELLASSAAVAIDVGALRHEHRHGDAARAGEKKPTSDP